MFRCVPDPHYSIEKSMIQTSELVIDQLAVRVFGNGPDLALIHGWGIGAGVWAPVIESLADHCRVHVVDLPGYGGSKNALRDAHHSLPGIADAVMAQLPAGTTLAGWSLGGLVAMAALARHSAKVGKLALISATPSFLQRPDWPHGVPSNMLDIFESALKLTPSLLLRRFNAQINQGDEHAKDLTKLTETLTHDDTPDVSALKGGLTLLREIDLRPVLPKIPHPTLIIHGEHDPLMKLAGAETTRNLFPNARLEVFKGASHIPFLSQPEHFARTLARFASQGHA